MPKVSRESAAHVDDFGAALDRHEDLEGYTRSEERRVGKECSS